VRNYRLFAGGQLVSLTGVWMQYTAQDWLVLALGGRGTGLGVTLALQFGPMLLVGLYAGVLADRFDKRRLLLITQATAGLLAACFAALLAAGLASLPGVFVFAGLLGIVFAVDSPTRQAFVIEMVGPDRVANAVALNSVTFNSARVVGPAIAGAVLAAAGAVTGSAWVFAANAASYAAVLTGLALMRTAELHPARPVARAAGQLRAGLRYARAHRTIMLTLVLVGVVGTLGVNFPVTVALMAREEFHGGAASYGLFTSVLAAGSLIGAARSTRRRTPRLVTLVRSAGAFGVCELVAAAAPTPLLFALALVPTGTAVLVFTTTANASVQLATDPGMRGRVMSLYLLVFLGGTPVGAPAIGALSQWLGPRAGLAAGGIACAVAAAAVSVPLLSSERSRTSERRPEHPSAAGPADTGPATAEGPSSVRDDPGRDRSSQPHASARRPARCVRQERPCRPRPRTAPPGPSP
jgi:MFS family permease